MHAVRRAARHAARGSSFERRFRRRARDVLGVDVPILGVAGDQQAALFGQGCCGAGEAARTRTAPARFFCSTPADRRRASAGGGCSRPSRATRAGEPAFALEAAIFIAGAADAVAARWTWHHPRRRGDRGAGAIDRVHGRRLLRPGARRARRAALGAGRARHDRGPHARHDAGASRARGARGDGVRHGRGAREMRAARAAPISRGCASTAARRRTIG